MRISSKIHIILAIIAFLFSTVLKGQQQVELVPYSIIPLDPIPDCRLELNIEAIRSHGRVWKYQGEAIVDGKKMADAQWSATIVDKRNN